MGVSDNIRRAGPSKTAVIDQNKLGLKVDPGPYVATVMEHVKGNRLGQLKVFIPEWGGKISPTTEYTTVSYASPFYGKTYGTDSQELPIDSPATSGQSYGMWMIPPDIGNKVLVMFANGDRDRGFWLGCIYDSSSHHMVPANGRAIGGKDKTMVPPGDQSVSIGNDSVLPVTEYNAKVDTAFQSDGLVATPRYAHQYQTAVLLQQGLDRDPIRGAISSSSMREAPSNVYGISTPGRSATKTPQLGTDKDLVIFRKGGHSFVMDDGAAGDDINSEGTDQLIRLRTTGGHQILMNDTENVLYIGSQSGDTWLEFSKEGQLHVFSSNGINLRTKGVMNFHSDAAIIMQSPVIQMNASDTTGQGGQSAIIMNTTGQMAIKATMGASIAADGPLSLSSLSMGSFKCGAMLSLSSAGMTSVYGTLLKLNTGMPGIPTIVTTTPTNVLQDTIYSDGTKAWVSSTGAVSSACTQVPAHEPWVSTDGKSRPTPKIPGQSGNSLAGFATAAAMSGLVGSLTSSLFG